MTAPVTGLGVVADDLTGACDLAGRVREAGLDARVRLNTSSMRSATASCEVVALKIRTAPAEEAAAAAARAAALVGPGRLLYQKYCSTFDSTDAGTIGPVADALADATAPDAVTVGTPATPGSVRTQYAGHLFVDGRLLSESPMRDHPLTPMRDPDLVRVLGAQTPRAVALVPHAALRDGADAVADRVRETVAAGARHVLVDALDEDDLDVVAAAVLALHAAGRLPVVAAGAAGLATALARATSTGGAADPLPRVPAGGRLVVCGSASASTRRQVAAFDGPRIDVDVLDLAARGADGVAGRLARALRTAGDEPVLLAALSDPDRLRTARMELGARAAADLLERSLAELAADAVERHGVTRLVVAGGETSGAVVAGLGVVELAVGAQVAPGVPWTVGEHRTGPVGLLLKSGNFGPDDLFRTAWRDEP